MPRTGRNGAPMPPAWRARNSAPQGYSRQSSRPACTAARKFGAMPYSSRPPRSPSWTSAAAAARSVQTGGIVVSRYGMDPQMGQQVEENAGGGAPDHLLAVLPEAHPGGAALENVGAGAPALRGVTLPQRQGQE